MDEILLFLINNCSFLYKDHKFRFVDSKVTDHFGGDSYLIMSSETFKLRFCRDRGQIFFDIQSNLIQGKKDWFSIDVVRKLIQKEDEYFALMDEKNAKFLKVNFEKIIDLFSLTNVKKTCMELKKLERIRSREIFS